VKPSHHGRIGKKNNVIIERDLLRRLFTLLIQQIHDTKLANIVPQKSCNLAASLGKAGLERLPGKTRKCFVDNPTLQEDYDFLYDAGVFGVFGPGTKISKAAIQILELLIKSTQD
jgi:hypothetical protein